jgi:hypothetical protein
MTSRAIPLFLTFPTRSDKSPPNGRRGLLRRKGQQQPKTYCQYHCDENAPGFECSGKNFGKLFAMHGIPPCNDFLDYTEPAQSHAFQF